MEASFLFSVAVFLAAACIMVPVCKFTGLGSVIGYLLAGVLIGPFVLGFIDDPETILHFSEFGVVMMLFLIGLELKPSELWDMKGRLLGFGGVQVSVTAAVIFAVAMLTGLQWGQSALIALALALSSTAIALQILQESDSMDSGAGKSAFSVLLFQDIAVIPIIALIPVFAAYAGVDIVEAAQDVAHGAADGHGTDSGHDGGFQAPSGWLYAVCLFGVFAGMILSGRLLLNPIFNFIARNNVREIFTAIALLLVIGAALMMQWLGLSAALGAFVAGVVLAESHYRHQLERDIEPFKALLLGLFFMSVGMSLDFATLADYPIAVCLLVIGLIGGKFAILFALAKISKMGRSETLIFAGLLAQGGEFALVLFQYGRSAGAISLQNAQILSAVVALSMAATPILLLLIDRLVIRRMNNASVDIKDVETVPKSGLNKKIIVLGFGRVGQVIGRVLSAQGCEMTIIDHDPDHIEFIKQFDYKVYYGSAVDVDLLRTAGAQSADLIVVAIDNRERATRAAAQIIEHFPDAKVLVRARNRQHVFDLAELGGIDVIERETFFGSVEMGRQALHLVGIEESEAAKLAKTFTDHDLQMLEVQIAQAGDIEKMREIGRAGRRNLENTLNADRARGSDG